MNEFTYMTILACITNQLSHILDAHWYGECLQK